ncbi:hypothetical protein [Lactobacillus amylovorus]|uniref:hypothetical protein n=1 Tax=Lactobacillus amylovorus TaxID=1604 RepID=UPI003D087CB1
MANSRNELNKFALKTFKHMKDRSDMENSSAFIAKIVKYDSKKHLADVQPLANLIDGQKASQLLEIPVAENCYIIDEILERLKPDFTATDTNSRISAHDNSNFVSHYPKHKLLRAGVPVVCVTLDRDNDNWKGGREANTYDPETLRTHDINDSIVIGVLGGDAVYG